MTTYDKTINVNVPEGVTTLNLGINIAITNSGGGGGVSPYGTDFAMEVETTTASETFTIPCQNVGVFDASIDWGDGNVSAITAFNDADLTHTYDAAGLHEIRVSGTFPNINFANAGDKDKVTRVMQLGNVGWQTFEAAFRGCGNMTSFKSGTCDTSDVTDMFAMVMSCPNLTTVDVSTMDTSSATSMPYMFFGCPAATLDVSNFNTSLVTNMSHMFRDCSGLATLDVSNFDTSSVSSMRNMLDGMGVIDVVGIDSFNIDAVTNLFDFAEASTFPTARYDAILTSWDAQTPNNGLAVNFGLSTYSAGVPATARANLIADHNWTITDGGLAA